MSHRNESYLLKIESVYTFAVRNDYLNKVMVQNEALMVLEAQAFRGPV